MGSAGVRGRTMSAAEYAGRLLAKLSAIAQAADEAVQAAEGLAALDQGEGDAGAGKKGDGVDGMEEAVRWLPSIKQSLERIQLECAELRFSARELREAVPPPDSLQPRLF